jgi:Protein of unknown function (DUF2867)
LKVSGSAFLLQHSESWTARRAPEFSVVNIHATEIPAPRERIFAELGGPGLLLPARRWRLLFGLRQAIGKLCGWDRGVVSHPPQALEAGKHFAFFAIEWVDAPREAGMGMKNRLTSALMCWVLEEIPQGTKVFNVTLANFTGWQGRNYWRLIRPFHDGLIEDSLKELARRVASQTAARLA